MTKQTAKSIMVRPGNNVEEVLIPNSFPYFNFILEQENFCEEESELITIEEGISLLMSNQESVSHLEGSKGVNDKIISGTFFVIGTDEDNSITSLTDDSIDKYTKLLS